MEGQELASKYNLAAQWEAESIFGYGVEVEYSRSTRKSGKGRRIYFSVKRNDVVIDELVFSLFTVESAVDDFEKKETMETENGVQ